MQPYQTSYPNQMNMGMNQNFNPYGQIQNPYIDRMNQLQQYQQNLGGTQMSLPNNQQPQPQGLIGKMVNDVSMVSPNDVPMDGNVAIFPKNDMSEIYCKQWKQDGTIQTVIYRPVQAESPQDGANMPQMDFNALNEDVRALREEITERFDRLEKSMGKTTTRGKKTEVSDNE